MANTPTLKEPTGTAAGGAQRWGGPDAVHCAQLIKGTHSTEAIQQAAIDGLIAAIDAATLGLDAKDSVRVASTGNIDLASAIDPNPIDGVTLVNGNRILLKNQTTGSENGIYDCVTAIDPTTWVRSSDADINDKVNSGMYCWIEEGIANADKGFTLTTNDPITLNTTVLSFSQFSGLGQITAGIALKKTADVLDLDIDELTFELTPAGNDVLIILDTSAGTIKKITHDDLQDKVKRQALIVAVGDETTVLTVGTAKITFRMPYAFTLTGVRTSLTTAGTGVALVTVDINEAGVTILSTKITIDATEKTSQTAATPPVISDTALADDAEMTVDIDTIDTDNVAAGLKITLIGFKT